MSYYPDKIIDYDNFLEIIKEDKGSLYIYGAYSKEVGSKVEYTVSFKSVTQTTNFIVRAIGEDKLHKIIDEIDALNGVAATPLTIEIYISTLMFHMLIPEYF